MIKFNPAPRLPALLLCLPALAAQAAPEEMTIDPGHTFPTFEVRHLNVATQRGRFNRTQGRVSLDLEAGSGSAQISIDTASVDTGNPELDKLLRTRSYFNVRDYPQISFKSTAMEFADGKPALIHGELTFLGETRPVDLKVLYFGCSRLPFVGNRCGADLMARFKRSDFGMNTMLGFVSDEVTMQIQVEAVKGRAVEPPPPAPEPAAETPAASPGAAPPTRP
jgi:polyisoprenoid-binding protein YceI